MSTQPNTVVERPEDDGSCPEVPSEEEFEEHPQVMEARREFFGNKARSIAEVCPDATPETLTTAQICKVMDKEVEWLEAKISAETNPLFVWLEVLIRFVIPEFTNDPNGTVMHTHKRVKEICEEIHTEREKFRVEWESKKKEEDDSDGLDPHFARYEGSGRMECRFQEVPKINRLFKLRKRLTSSIGTKIGNFIQDKVSGYLAKNPDMSILTYADYVDGMTRELYAPFTTQSFCHSISHSESAEVHRDVYEKYAHRYYVESDYWGEALHYIHRAEKYRRCVESAKASSGYWTTEFIHDQILAKINTMQSICWCNRWRDDSLVDDDGEIVALIPSKIHDTVKSDWSYFIYLRRHYTREMNTKCFSTPTRVCECPTWRDHWVDSYHDLTPAEKSHVDRMAMKKVKENRDKRNFGTRCEMRYHYTGDM